MFASFKQISIEDFADNLKNKLQNEKKIIQLWTYTYLETLFYAGKFRNKVVKIILTKEDLMARKINEFCFLNHHQHKK